MDKFKPLWFFQDCDGMVMRNIILFLIFMVSAELVVATQQVEDVLTYQGTNFSIEQTPLTSIFEGTPLIELLGQNVICSANWRGYQAKWKIENNYLYLKEIIKEPCSSGGKTIPLNSVFPNGTDQIKATWYTGRITSRTGKSWTEEKKLESETATVVVYKYEVDVFDVYDGVLVEKRTEVVVSGIYEENKNK